MPIVIERFPEEFIELAKEIQLHPNLLFELATSDAETFSDKLGVIAGYCEIILDGYYDRDDLIKIAGKCIEILREKRTLVLN